MAAIATQASRLARRSLTVVHPLAILRALSSVANASSARPSSDPARRDYWQDIFRSGADTFSLPAVNPNLAAFYLDWSRLLSSSRINVFVPLCGCSADVTWLAEQTNTHVVALDFAADALERWGAANGGLDTVVASEAMTVLRGRTLPNVTFLRADVFDFPVRSFAGSMDLVWDRGALTSIAQEDRPEYVRLLQALLRPAPHAALLVEILSCNLAMDGAMDSEACRRELLSGGFDDIETLADEDVRDAYPQFRPPGLAHLREVLLHARRRHC